MIIKNLFNEIIVYNKSIFKYEDNITKNVVNHIKFKNIMI